MGVSHVSKRIPQAVQKGIDSSPSLSIVLAKANAQIRFYRGESGETQSRQNLSKDTEDIIAQRESELLDIAKPKSEKIYAKHISLPKLNDISPYAFGNEEKQIESEDFGNVQELELEIRKKRLIYRSKQRGWLEVDLLLGTWANENVNDLPDDELDLFEELVNEETIDIYNILTLRTDIPDRLDNNVVRSIQEWAKMSPLGKADKEAYEDAKKKNNLI